MDKSNEEVVLFPLQSHDPAVKVLRIARVPEGKLDNKLVHHIAGGPYKGIIVSKATEAYPSRERPHAVREFLAHVLDKKTTRRSNKQLRERRKVFMWFKDGNWDREQIADRFFKTLIDPEQFPKDYISFVKKVIVMAKSYHMLRTIELELSPAMEEYRTAGGAAGYRTSWIERPTYLQNDESPVRAEAPRKRPVSTPVSGFITPPEAKQSPEGTLMNENKSTPGQLPKVQEERQKTEPATVSTEQRINAYPGSQADRSPRQTQQDKTPENVVEVRIVEKRVTKSMTSSPDGEKVTVKEEKSEERLTEEELAADRLLLLTTLEEAFPNAMDAENISSVSGLNGRRTELALRDCSSRGLVRELDGARWIRVSTVRRKPKPESRLSTYSRLSTASKHDFQVVGQMPVLPDRDQPTIAVITLLYCEKQAVDVMMETKTTYVRYKTEGEGQVYTLGQIGLHKVVSTKLSRVGQGQGATVSAGNLITRLLGTFSKVEHVFLVGVGGSIPDYEDFVHHVRCGDVVISKAHSEGSATYISVTEVEGDVTSGDVAFSTRTWEPRDPTLWSVLSELSERYSATSMIQTTVQTAIRNALSELEGHGLQYTKPDQETDRLYKLSPDGSWTQVEHPQPADDEAAGKRAKAGEPTLFFGIVGTGYDLLVTDKADVRHEFALFNNVYALDVGFEAVMESIDGNRRESFCVIRGVADYKDGLSGSEWQPYAALAAAAVFKTILGKLPTVRK